MTFLNHKVNSSIGAITLFLISSLFSVHVGATEICGAAGYSTYLSATVLAPPSSLETPSTTTISNSNLCVNAFSLDLSDSNYKGYYILIEVQLEYFPNDTNSLYYNPYLIGNLGSIPTLDSYSAGSFAQKDQSGFINRKSYHYIELTNSDTNNGGGTYYIAFYRDFSNPSNYYSGLISYTVTITTDNKYMCPRNCNNQGQCKNGQCSCNSGYFDTDCSVQANLINVPGDETFVIQPMNWTFFYIPIQDYDNSFQIAFLGYSLPLTIYYNEILPNSYILPSLDSTAKNQPISLNDSPFDFVYTGGSDDSDDNNDIYIIGFSNTDPSLQPTSITYQVTVTSSSSNSTNVVMTIIISILAFFIAVTILIIIFKLRQLKRLRLQAERVQVAQAQVQATPQFLTPEQIDQYFSKTPYRKLRNHFQTSCSICLEDFESESSCRRLYCGHVYHDACIEEWLKKHDKCPNCNKEMTLAAIKEFVKNPFLFSPNSKIQSMTFDFRHATINRLQTQPTSPLTSPGARQQKPQTHIEQLQEPEEQRIQVDTIEDTNTAYVRRSNRQTSIDMQMHPIISRQVNRQGTIDITPTQVRIMSPNETIH